MQLAPIDVGIFAAYILLVMALGLYAARKTTGTKRDYFLAGDKLPWWMVGGSIVASNMSSHQFVGMTGAAYSRGFVVITAEWAAVLIGLNALLWVFLPFYLRNGFYTMPEYLERRYGGVARAAYGGLIILVYVFVEISAVLYLGALAVHALLGIPMMVSIVALAVLTAIYTITGGLRAVVWTEMLQLGVLLVGGVTLCIATVHAVGGWSEVMRTSTDWHLMLPSSDPDWPWTQYLGGALCISTFYWATNQFIVQRALASRSEWDARMGVIGAQYVKFLLPFMTVVPGLMAARLYPNLAKADLAFPTLVENLLPSGMIGIVLAGLIAAIMSHVSGALNSCTTIASVDFFLPYIRKDASEVQVVRFGKAVGVVVMLVGILWAQILVSHSERPVFIYLMNAYGYFAPGIGAMFLLGIFWKRTTHMGALAAGAATVPISALLDAVFKHLPFANRTGIAFWACIAIGMLVSLVTRPKPDSELEGLVWTRKSLAPGGDEARTSRGWRNPALWWLAITIIVTAMYIRYW